MADDEPCHDPDNYGHTADDTTDNATRNYAGF
jgi:hypothetical protein